MTSPSLSSDSDTITVDVVSESGDQVTELLLPSASDSGVPASPSMAYRLMKRSSSTDSGADTRRESTTSSLDDPNRRTSVISNVDKESDTPSSGHGTHEQSRNTSIDQGDQSGIKINPLVRGESSDKESEIGSDHQSEGKSDSTNPVVSDDSSSGQQLSSEPPTSGRSGIQFSDSSSGHPELQVSDSDPSRSEAVPRSDLESSELRTNSGALMLVQMSTTPDGYRSIPTVTPDQSLNDPEGNWPPQQNKFEAAIPKPPSILSWNDLVFTLSKTFTYLFGLIYLTGLYCDFWFTTSPAAFNSSEVSFTYITSIMAFAIFALVDSSSITSLLIIPALVISFALHIYFTFIFGSYYRWWYGFATFYLFFKTIYAFSVLLSKNATDLVKETFQYLLDKKHYEMIYSPAPQAEQISAEEGESVSPPLIDDSSSDQGPSPRRSKPFPLASSSESGDATPVLYIAEAQIHPHDSPSSGTTNNS